uniref:Uncharacterized protein n=1 Tax=Cucumis sativus TaxID=3659 RepID=A0A0A0KVK0_CUCSA
MSFFCIYARLLCRSSTASSKFCLHTPRDFNDPIFKLESFARFVSKMRCSMVIFKADVGSDAPFTVDRQSAGKAASSQRADPWAWLMKTATRRKTIEKETKCFSPIVNLINYLRYELLYLFLGFFLEVAKMRNGQGVVL